MNALTFRKSLLSVLLPTALLCHAWAAEPTKAHDPKIPLAPGEVADPGQAKQAPKLPPEYADPEEVAGLPRVLIIGDSVSIAYTQVVRRELEGIANVYRIKANGGATKTALGSYGLCRWLKDDEKWDLIFFNHGLHDASYRFDNGVDKDKDGNYACPARGCKPYVSVEEYEKNLHAIISILRKTGAKLVFGTTTPIPDSLAEKYVENSELPYNEVAKKVMEAEAVTVIDLWTAVKPEQEKLQGPRNVHFRPEGSEVLGKTVAVAIKHVIGRENGRE
jgi:acyl-CoA thioesterase-1